jgi:hypothetical protein
MPLEYWNPSNLGAGYALSAPVKAPFALRPDCDGLVRSTGELIGAEYVSPFGKSRRIGCTHCGNPAIQTHPVKLPFIQGTGGAASYDAGLKFVESSMTA